MKVKLLSRRGGKTTIAIRESARKQIPIVCFHYHEIDCVQRLAVTLGVTIPQPIRFEDLLKNQKNYPEVIIDSLDVCLTRLTPHTKIVMVTINDD